VPSIAQNNVKTLMQAGQDYYSKKEYSQALQQFLRADSLVKNDLSPAYWIGKTYAEIKGRELNAIPYFERALKMRNVPYDIHRYLGTLYHQTFLFDKAIRQFSLYLSKASPNDGFIAYCERMIEISANAKNVAGKKSNKSIKALSQVINKGYSEYAPFISADMQTMVFTRFDYDNATKETDKLKKFFLISRTVDGELWEEPKKLELPTGLNIENIELAGISQDGFTLFLSIGDRATANLFSAQIEGTKLTKLVQLPSAINSRFGEFSISFSYDGMSCIFSSNRPGGIGGIDLYRSNLNPDESWSNPVNLGTTINTRFNEDGPFWHPDGRKFVFASEGHQSIGGYDLYETTLNKDDFWTPPTSLDFANTVYDDRYYMIDAKGQKAFFAQALNFFPGRYKIFSTDLQENIPLTMVKGSIRVGNPPKPHSAKIKVYDNETKERVKYTYSPNEFTGKYLMIFPPGRNYDIIIEAEGFLPQMVNVYIPEQKYFYELFQEISLESIEFKNQRIGENIKVRNTFYDIYKTPLADTISPGVNRDEQKNYDHLLQIIGDIIYQTDSIGVESLEKMVQSPREKAQEKDYSKLFGLIEQAIETTDSVSLAVLDKSTLYDEVLIAPTYYQEGDPQKSLVTQVFGNDTVKTVPPLKADEQRVIVPKIIDEHESNLQFRNSRLSDRRYVFTETIYFDVNDITIDTKYYSIVKTVTDLMLNNKTLGVELHGYTDPQGAEVYNLLLSEKRARSVLKHIVGLGVKGHRAIVAGHGVDYSPVELTDKKDVFGVKRRVELKVFEVRGNE
jgi:outer membrane protein OmpA-like peptidoglycan-associated protein